MVDMDQRLSTLTSDQLTIARANNFVRLTQKLVACDNRPGPAIDDYILENPRSLDVDLLLKAGVTPGTTHDPGWSPLAQPPSWQAAILALARPLSLLGKSESRVRHVPTNVSVAAQTAGASYAWVGQSGIKPVSNMAFQSMTLAPTKASGIIIVTSELLKLTTPAAVATLRGDLVRGLAFYLDQQLTDQTVAAVANISPASITNQAPSFGSAGTSAANCLTDLKKLYATYYAVNQDAGSALGYMSPANASAAAAATGWQALGANGGELWGVRWETSAACGSRVIMFDPQALAVADAGTVEIMASRQASIEMDTAASSPQTAGTVLVNLWASGLVGLRCERGINWRLGRANAAVYTVASWV